MNHIACDLNTSGNAFHSQQQEKTQQVTFDNEALPPSYMHALQSKCLLSKAPIGTIRRSRAVGGGGSATRKATLARWAMSSSVEGAMRAQEIFMKHWRRLKRDLNFCSGIIICNRSLMKNDFQLDSPPHVLPLPSSFCE